MGEMVWLLIGKFCGLEYVSGTKPNCGPSSWEQELQIYTRPRMLHQYY